jgi:hypothetical protein
MIEAKRKYAAWRQQVTQRLEASGNFQDASNFSSCERNFNVNVCENNWTHQPQKIPFSCKLRICPDCERREQARKLALYVPVIYDLLALDHSHNYSLRKIELTTPFELSSPTAAADFRAAWKALERFLSLFWLRSPKFGGLPLTPSEVRKGTISHASHGLGYIAASEYGERGRKLHFHVIAYSPWMDHKHISRIWYEATKRTASIVWVRALDSENLVDATADTLKYCTKFQGLHAVDAVKLLDVLRGTKRLRSYGIFRNLKKADKAVCTCDICGSGKQLVRPFDYLNYCLERNISPDAEIVEAMGQVYAGC